MSIILKNSTMVNPANETPQETLWLSRLDMITRPINSHTQSLLIYNQINCNNNKNQTFFDVEILKESLSKTLVAFYPLAGRLKMNESNGRYEIDCNSKGVLFVEAETTRTLDELKLNDDFRKLMVPECDYSKGLDSLPLIMCQFTRFACGGVCFGLAVHHHAIDAASCAYFTNSWGRLASGLEIVVMPVHDRVPYLSPRQPRQIKFRHSEFEPPLPPLSPKNESALGKVCDIVECVFKLSKNEIDDLKQEAMCNVTPQSNKQLTTFEILAGHVWRCACKARKLADDQDVKLYTIVNGRSWLNDPALPQGFCGNVIFYPTCTVKAKEIMHNQLGHVASKLHDMLKKMKDSEYLRSTIDYIESMPDLEPFVRTEHIFTCPNLYVNSWASIPFDEADFGWGKPIFMLNGGVKREGQAFFVPSTNGDGSLSLAIKLFTPHMALFEKYFYAIGNRIDKGELRLSKEGRSKSRL